MQIKAQDIYIICIPEVTKVQKKVVLINCSNCVAEKKICKAQPHTANIFVALFTVFHCVPISTVILTVILLYGLHLIAAPIIE